MSSVMSANAVLPLDKPVVVIALAEPVIVVPPRMGAWKIGKSFVVRLSILQLR